MNSSETITKLASALLNFNNEIIKISKDSTNPYFGNKYASLDVIIEIARPILTQNGLSVLQMPSGDGINVILKTILLHESGEFIESEALIVKPVKTDPQAVGSCITYMRRYSYSSVLSLNTGGDDDGNAASGKHDTNKEKAPSIKTSPKPEPKTAIETQKADAAAKQTINDMKGAAIKLQRPFSPKDLKKRFISNPLIKDKSKLTEQSEKNLVFLLDFYDLTEFQSKIFEFFWHIDTIKQLTENEAVIMIKWLNPSNEKVNPLTKQEINLLLEILT